MAKSKTGLSYFRTDTDKYQDMRIKRLKHNFGCAGVAVYDYLLCEIYRDKGCFLVWDENRAFDVADYFGLKENTVDEIVTYCGVVGLFDKEVLSGGKIITSASIQKRYMEMCNRAKRTDIEIPEFCKIIREESPKLREKSEIIREESPIKEKYSKNKEKYISTNVEDIPKESPLPLFDDEDSSSPNNLEETVEPKVVVEMWNSICVSLPKVIQISESRKRKIKVRVKEFGQEPLERIREIFTLIESSRFLCGDNQRGWRATFDWVFENDKNWCKVLEGAYDRSKANGDKDSGGKCDEDSAERRRYILEKFKNG